MRRLIGVAVLAAVLAQPAGAGPKRLPRNMRPVPIGSAAEWFNPDSYPPEAIRAARQGRAVVEVGVDSVGKVVSCNVKVSSGTDALDRRTCELAMTRGQFNPATDGKGRPTASVYLLPVRWVLPEDEADTPKTLPAASAGDLDMAVEVELTVDPQGKLVSCRVVTAKLPKGATGDPCAHEKVGAQVTPGWTRDGRPVGAVIRRRLAQTITVAP